MFNKKYVFMLLLMMSMPMLLASSGLSKDQDAAKTKKPNQKPQTPAKPIRPVTINLKHGDPLHGDFIQADAEGIDIEVKTIRQHISLDNVASVVFDNEQKSLGGTQPPSRDTILAVEAGL